MLCSILHCQPVHSTLYTVRYVHYSPVKYKYSSHRGHSLLGWSWSESCPTFPETEARTWFVLWCKFRKAVFAEISAKIYISLPPPGPIPGALAALPKIRTKIHRRLYRIFVYSARPPLLANFLGVPVRYLQIHKLLWLNLYYFWKFIL